MPDVLLISRSQFAKLRAEYPFAVEVYKSASFLYFLSLYMLRCHSVDLYLFIHSVHISNSILNHPRFLSGQGVGLLYPKDADLIPAVVAAFLVDAKNDNAPV